jgi:hypothetical protein
MASDLDPGAQDPDLEYLVMQLRHRGAPLRSVEETEAPPSGRCPHSGLTIPECSCTSCTRELILRYRPGTFLG